MWFLLFLICDGGSLVGSTTFLRGSASRFCVVFFWTLVLVLFLTFAFIHRFCFEFACGTCLCPSRH